MAAAHSGSSQAAARIHTCHAALARSHTPRQTHTAEPTGAEAQKVGRAAAESLAASAALAAGLREGQGLQAVAAAAELLVAS